MVDIARESALKMLNILDRKSMTLDAVIEDTAEAENRLSRLDRSLVNALVFGVVRWRGKIDFVIGHFSKTPLKKIRPDVLNILRLGVFQIMFMSKIPDSAAVNTSVNMAKKNSPPWVGKFVNAILRNITRNQDKIPFPSKDNNIQLYLSTMKSYPEWLVQRWLKRFDSDSAADLCDAMNEIPGITLRTNTLKSSRENLLKSIENDVKQSVKTSYSPFGISVNNPQIPISDMTAFKNGWFQVQDEAAQIVSMLVNPAPGDRVLDACAGLGGKTGHLAQLMENRGEIIALDNIPAKLKRLQSEMNRLGAKIVKTESIDLNEPVNKDRLGMFDKILVDAPCSGLGVLRRNPDAKWSQSKKNLNRYKKRQVKFLNHLKSLLNPGGSIVYAVCSTEPEEGKGVVDSFLHSSASFSVSSEYIKSFPNLKELADKSGTISTLPHLHDMDGFFTARLVNNK